MKKPDYVTCVDCWNLVEKSTATVMPDEGPICEWCRDIRPTRRLMPMRLQREEILYVAFWVIILGVMIYQIVTQPDARFDACPVPTATQPVVPFTDDQGAPPLGEMDIPGAASWSGDEPGADGRER